MVIFFSATVKAKEEKTASHMNMGSIKICTPFWCLYNKGKKHQDVFYTVNMSLELLTLIRKYI